MLAYWLTQSIIDLLSREIRQILWKSFSVHDWADLSNCLLIYFTEDKYDHWLAYALLTEDLSITYFYRPEADGIQRCGISKVCLNKHYHLHSFAITQYNTIPILQLTKTFTTLTIYVQLKFKHMDQNIGSG